MKSLRRMLRQVTDSMLARGCSRFDWTGRNSRDVREERRPHVHVQHAEGEAKFWIDPTVALHANYGLKPKRLAEAEKLVEEHLNEIRSAWAKHFPD